MHVQELRSLVSTYRTGHWAASASASGVAQVEELIEQVVARHALKLALGLRFGSDEFDSFVYAAPLVGKLSPDSTSSIRMTRLAGAFTPDASPRCAAYTVDYTRGTRYPRA
ncbi:hypothetical protein CERSUDRAFT_88985 [Gelatoporia subvermispora B]|uniref:Uncharacterized protein n=1 Tax=Ceriporiopsis subvermispora (strain B) TaxID=914234 RepID=M2QHD4_CERS8|nr:hypothetical protein CERSUDRAFT_88985 [Gelatoporia subvermispora B]